VDTGATETVILIPTLRIRLLGDFLVLADDTPLATLNVPRLQALLAYLVLKRSAPQPRPHLAFLLWPDSTEAQARANLRKLLHQLHQALPDAERFLHADTQTVQWRPDARFTLDVAEFERALARAEQAERNKERIAERQALQEAVEAYHGDLLPSCYDEWVLPERERLRQAFLGALERVVALLERARDFGAAIGYTQRLLRHEPLREETYRDLMRLQMRSGDRIGALETYRTCVTVLERELGVEPSAATQELYDRLVRRDTATAPAHNLPAQTTSFVGREEEVAELIHLLEISTCRLVTILGPGGIGKTRLVLQAGSQLLADYPDGVWFVALAPISDSGLVASAIAQTFDVREAGGRPLLDRLKDYLRDKQLLLLLDNFEQVIEAAPLIGELLAAAPGLKVVVTSRAVLRLYGEHELVVPSLRLPNRTDQVSPTQLTQYAATQLFVERAQVVRADFSATHENAPAIAQICVRLDGLPLAIELAATRVKLFPPQSLVARLERRLPLLRGGARDLPARQRTLRDTIAWSYDLLAPAEQMLFARLAVFVGGWTIEAAEAVCNANDDLGIAIVDGLAALIDQSLVRQGPGINGEPRFTMLETIREYALERLQATGEVGRMRDCHLAYYLTLVERAERQRQGTALEQWYERLTAEIDNLRAARQWSRTAASSAEAELRLVGALWWFWLGMGNTFEALAWLEVALERRSGVAPRLQALVLLGAGEMCLEQGDYQRATALYQESLALYRGFGDQRGIARALHYLGYMERLRGNYEEARLYQEECLKLYREIGEIKDASWALLMLGDVFEDQGDHQQATSYFCEALTHNQPLADKEVCGWATINLGRIAHAQGNPEQATALYQEGLALFRNLKYQYGIAHVLTDLGDVAHTQGDDERAMAFYRESLGLLRETGGPHYICKCLEGAAGMAGIQGRPEQAARLFGAVERLRDSTATPIRPVDRVTYHRLVDTTRAQLDDKTFAAAWAEGRAMTLEQAIAYALAPN
jgi:predicted ATPase/DNA-binding SARP family transcriptional activator